jgi:hypothetical protein
MGREKVSTIAYEVGAAAFSNALRTLLYSIMQFHVQLLPIHQLLTATSMPTLERELHSYSKLFNCRSPPTQSADSSLDATQQSV